MHQIAKKTWALILALCLILGVLPIGASAAVVDGADYITQQLSLGEDLVLHLRASLPEKYADLAKDATATITYAGKTKTYHMGDMEPDENGMYDLPVEMAVAEMTENINLVVDAKYLGMNIEVINENYSIRNYLEAVIEGDFSQTTKDLCLELLNMGAWAQLYFGHNIANLANANYSTSAIHAVPEESPAVISEGAVDGIRLYGTSVRFLSKTAVRFYFVADGAVDGYTFTIDGVEYEPVAKDGMYYIETPGINPQNMSDVITVNVTDGAKNLSIGYAPIWFFIRTYHKTEDEYSLALMEAAYSYYKEAESYKTQICMDVDISTLSGDYESIGLGFYPLDFEGDINNHIDRIEIPTGTAYTVKLDQGKYLVDGEFLGIGVTVLGGPAWDAKLEDGSPDRHNIKISDLRLEGPEDRAIDLTFATIASGNDGTGFTNANAGGTAAVADGVISITNGFFTDGYKITFNEIDTYLKLDMEVNTLSGSYESIGIGFYPMDFEGDINNHIDRIEVPTGTTYTVQLDLSKYLVDGELPGIGFAVLGGPAWDAKLEDGTPDRHSISISDIRLEGELNQNIDLSRASLACGQDGTGFTNANAGGTATVADGIISITNGFFTDGYKLTFVDESIPEETEPEETEPDVTEPDVTEPPATEPPATEPDTYLCIDLLFTTGGGSTDPVEIGFFPYNFAGDINDNTDKITVTAGQKTTVKLDLAKYLVDGELTGIGFAIFGGPEWDAKLPDGYTPDRHTITISAVYLEGEQDTVYDLSKSAWAGGNNGTGFTNANGSGAAAIGSEIVITNGFRYDGHKISLVEDTSTYLCLDMLITTLGGSTDPIEVRFYPYNYEGSVHSAFTDKITIIAGQKTTVRLKIDNYLVDGELAGIGFAIFGGPTWDAKLPDGYTPDRHTVTISNAHLEGNQSMAFDLSKSVWASAANAGYTDANGSGTATIGSEIVITNGFCYDGHKISLVKDTNTFIVMDLLFTTLGGSTDPVEIGFFPSNFEGDINNWTDKITITAGTTATIKLNAEKYMVDGKVSGIGFAIFGGPAWDAKLPDGYTPDRHTLVISNAHLEGYQSMVFDLNESVWAGGTNGTGFSNANGSGAATIGSEIVITNGFQYDGHKISLVENTSTYLCMDLTLSTLGGSNDPVTIRLYNYNYEGSVGDGYTDLITVTAGATTMIKVKVDNYLVDGELPGFGFAIFGGPEWNTQLEDGTYDRHQVVISNVRLEGVQEQSFDLNGATVATGTNGTGYTWANSGGVASIVDGELVVTGGFCYDAHEITF